MLYKTIYNHNKYEPLRPQRKRHITCIKLLHLHKKETTKPIKTGHQKIHLNVKNKIKIHFLCENYGFCKYCKC